MAQTIVYQGTPDPSAVTKTDTFENAVGLYLIHNGNDDLEIDFYLQLEVSNTENRVIPQLLNPEFRQDTIICYPIPNEFQYTGLRMYGIPMLSFPANITVVVIHQDIDLQQMQSDINAILNIIDSGITDEQQTIYNYMIQLIISGITGSPPPLPPLPDLPSLPTGTGTGTGNGSGLSFGNGDGFGTNLLFPIQVN